VEEVSQHRSLTDVFLLKTNRDLTAGEGDALCAKEILDC
jgi:hypothetical protein